MNLFDAFTRAADANADKAAVYWGESEFSYRQLWRESVWVANWLADHGVRPGDRVGIWLRNRPEFIPALMGVLGVGAVAVPVNNFLKGTEVGFILGDCGAGVLLTEAALADAEPGLKAELPGLRFLQVDQLAAHGGGTSSPGVLKPMATRVESDLAVIIYTSGTTGKPKGAMLSHGNLLCNVESCREMLEAVKLDRFVVLLPMFHSFMLCVGLLLPLTTGSSIVLIKSLHPPKNILAEIAARQATILPAIPQFFRTLTLIDLPKDFPLRICISGAAPLPVEVLRNFNRKFPFPLIEGYGLSEASPVVSLNPIRGPWKEGSIGVPVPGVEVTVQDDSGKALADREVGEICVRGGNVMSGYWNHPEETAQALRNGWLLTGDIGYRDADGYFFITDRKKDMLLVNGINVYPREVEEWLYQFPGVKEAAVVGIPDARRGEQPVAFVSLDDGAVLDKHALFRFLKGRLADYKVPRHVEVLPALPRNATGKILKTELRKAAGPRDASAPGT